MKGFFDLAATDRHKFSGLAHMSLTPANVVEVFLDPLVVVVCFIATLLAYDQMPGVAEAVLAIFAFFLTFPGNLRLTDSLKRMLRKGVMHWLVIVVLLGMFGYATRLIALFDEDVLLSWVLAVPLGMAVGRILAVWLLPLLIAAKGTYQAVIVGCNHTGLMLAEQFAQHPWLGIRLVGFFDDRQAARQPEGCRLELLGGLLELATYVKRHAIERIYIALPMATQPRIVKLLEDLRDTTVSTYFVPDIFVTELIQGRMDNVNGIPVFAVCETPFTGLNGLLKRGFDIAVSSLLLFVLSPVLLLCALAVKLSSPGPIIFKQRRYGLDGREILIYKFRSMCVCEDGATVVQATRADPRITRIGALLRKSSLDELPQLVNVLQGRMSIVGPRPHAVAHNEQYRKLIQGYMVRHKVRPGITGWAQVNGLRGETETLDKMARRIACDLDYLRNWSLSLDIWIIFKTVRTVLRGDEAY